MPVLYQVDDMSSVYEMHEKAEEWSWQDLEKYDSYNKWLTDPVHRAVAAFLEPVFAVPAGFADIRVINNPYWTTHYQPFFPFHRPGLQTRLSFASHLRSVMLLGKPAFLCIFFLPNVPALNPAVAVEFEAVLRGAEAEG